MSGRDPWPVGKLNDDLQMGKKELFRFGAWSIMDAGPDGSDSHGWASFIFHCESWETWEPIPTPYLANTYKKGKMVEAKPLPPQKMKKMKHCRTNMSGYRNKFCPECRRRIPEEVVALWTLQNFDKIQEISSER